MLLLSVMLSMLTAFAQGDVGGMVSGQVKSTSGEELINAIITFKNLQDSTKIYPTICDVQGRYHNYLMASTHMLFLILRKIIPPKRIGFW